MVRAIILLVGLILFAGEVTADEAALLELAGRELIVKWRQSPQSLDAEELLHDLADKAVSIRKILPAEDNRSPLSRLTVVRADCRQSAEELLVQLERDSRVEYAEFRPIRYLDGDPADRGENDDALDTVPNDPFYVQQWGLQAVDAEAAWIEVTGDPSVAIAVNDIGVWFGHPELEGTRWQNDAEVTGIAGEDDDGNGYVDDLYGYDFVDMDGDPTPEPFEPLQTHGTHVAGIAAAKRNNNRGIAGIASGCRIMGVRTGQHSSITHGYEGILYACRSGVKIINCSWGGNSDSQYEREVIQYALDHGCVVIASAGNSHSIDPHYPSSIEGVISVAASGLGDLSATFSNYGPSIDVSAPGVNMLSTVWDDDGNPSYASWQGTSMSAPLVAGICALAKVKYPTLDGAALAARVIGSSEPIDNVNPERAGWLGIGRVNAWRAVAGELEGIRLGRVVISEESGNGDGRILPGETAEISISVYNELNSIDGVVGTISSTEASLIIGTPVTVYGTVPAGGPSWSGSPFTLTLDGDSPRRRSIPITIELARSDGRIIGRATERIVVDTTWVSVDNGGLRLGFGENGCLGYHDYIDNVTLGPGLRIAAGLTHTLFHGSFLFGTGGKVADNVSHRGSDIRYDWRIVDGEYARIIDSERADIEARASFEDRGSEALEQLFVRADAAALGWTDETARDFLVLEYTITNQSVNSWPDAYLGFFMDWDIVASEVNSGGYDDAGDLAFAEQYQEGYSQVGIASVTHPLTTVQTLDNRAEFDGEIPWNDERKWELLNAGIMTETIGPKDISQIIAAGPLTVEAQSSITVAFAIVSGITREDLRESASRAREFYGGPVISRKPNDSKQYKQAAIYPNPVSSHEKLRLVLPEEGFATVRFYNILGQMVGTFEQVKSGQAGAILDPSRITAASGLLFYSIEVNGEQTLGKVVLLK